MGRIILSNFFTNMPKFEEYENEFKRLYPSYSDEHLREIFEFRVKFWKWLIENFDLFFNPPINESNNIL